jgi:hypothetical protein
MRPVLTLPLNRACAAKRQGAWLLGALIVACAPHLGAQPSQLAGRGNPATVVTAPSSPQSGAQLSAQERLDAIRLSLVEASLQTPTKVQSTTWTDHRGVMHEASSFKNGLQVQGVRVMGFERDEQGMPKAWLKMPESPAQTTKAATKTVAEAKAVDPACPNKSTAHNLRHVLKFSLHMPNYTHPLVAQWLPAALQEHWLSPLAQPQNQAWRLVPELSRPLLARESSAYERALLSNLPNDTPWEVTLQVTARTTSDGFGFAWTRSTPRDIDVRMTLTLSPTDRHRAPLQAQANLSVEMDLLEWQRPTLTPGSQAALLAQLRAWQGTLNTWLMCENVQPAITAAQQQQLKINAGALAGVQRGEEWLIADPARFPQQLMAKDGAPQTLLARVDAVSPHEAMLTVLAGPTQAVQPNWRAWPVQTLVQDTVLSTSNATAALAAKKK